MIPVFDLFLIAFTSVSVFFDLTDRRIPNWLILFGLAAAVVLNATQALSPLSHSLFGFLIGIGLLIIPFALGWIGAGDVKYFGVIGAFLGVAWLPRVAFYTALAAGTLALGHVIVNGFQTHGLKGLQVDFRLAITSFGHILPEPIATKIDKGRHGVPWGVAIGAGTIIAYYFDPRGRWAGF